MINRAFLLRPGLSRAAVGFAALILAAAGCGVDPGSSETTPSSASSPSENPPSADGGNGNGNGNGTGGIVWPSLPTGPDIPQILEVFVYRVLEKADSSQCTALFSPGGVEVETENGRFLVSLVGETEFRFVTGDKTRLLYEAAARLCAGDEPAARVAFGTAVGLGPWTIAAEDVETQTAVCTVWDTVAHLLDPSAGACTLQLATDGGTDATDDATPSDGPPATAGESDSSADDGAIESDGADATDAP